MGGVPGRVDETRKVLLTGLLQVAVPCWIEVLRHSSPAQRMERAVECARYVAEHGDDVLFRGGKDGRSAEAFNRLAEGVALCAFAPGGVTVFELHFEVGEDEDGAEKPD